MQIQKISNLKSSFGFNNKVIKQVTSKDVINGIIETIKNTTPQERIELQKSLGLNVENLYNFQPKFESLPTNIFSGEVFPKIHVTSKGASYLDNVGNVIRTELARIRGQLTKVSIKELKL